MQPPRPGFSLEASPDHPGWQRWRLNDGTAFNEVVLAPVLVRRESDSTARVRILPRAGHHNNGGHVHGGITLALIDVSLFAACKLLRNIDAAGSVTIGLETQFIGSGDMARPLDAVVEVLRETGRMVFLRGLVVQDDHIVASFSGTTRKPSRPRT